MMKKRVMVTFALVSAMAVILPGCGKANADTVSGTDMVSEETASEE